MVISSQPLPAKVWQRIKDPHVDMLTLDNTVYRIQRIPELGSGIVTGLQPCRCSSAFDSSCSSGSLPAFSPACSPPRLLLRLLRHLRSPRNSMLDALNSEAIQVYYQPIISLQDGKIAGAEALARWQQPDGTFLSPDIFIPLAEQTGLITQLTEDIVRKIFTDLGPSAAAAAGSAHIHQPVGR